MGHVVVTGDEALIRKIEHFRTMSDLQRAYDDMGGTVSDIANRLVPVKSGRLQGSIRYRTLSQKTVIQAGSRGFPYAPIVHYGQMPGWTAQPFLTQAFAIANNSRIPLILDKSMSEAMRIARV